MRHRIATLLGLGAVLSAAVLWLAAAPMASAGDPCYHGFEIPADTVAAANEINLKPCAFGPTVAKVAVGSTVKFVNDDKFGFTHLITGANQAWGSRDVELQPGKSVSYTFDKAGLYPYSCALHRGMSGVIVVGDAAAIDAAAVGSTSGTTTGTTTGAATTAGAATPSTASTAATGTDPLPLVVAAAVAGLFVGGLGVWLVGRRRTAREQRAVVPAG